MNRWPHLVLAITVTLLVTAQELDAADYALIARFPELSDYVGSDDFWTNAEAMLDGSWWATQFLVEPPDHADAHVDFAGGD